MTYVVMLKMGAKNAPAKLSNVGNYKRRSELCPRDIMSGFNVIDHPANKTSTSASDRTMKSEDTKIDG